MASNLSFGGGLIMPLVAASCLVSVGCSETTSDPLPEGVCSGVEIITENVAYASTHEENKLNLHVPANGAACPLLVWIPGGAWREAIPHIGPIVRKKVLRVLERGYAVASVAHRTSSTAVYPAQIHDVKAAIRFLRANAEEFRIDPGRIVVMGPSSGGHLAALLGTSHGVPELEDLTQGNSEMSSRIDGFIDCYGPTVMTAMDAALHEDGCDPTHHDGPTSPESELLGCTEGLEACPQQVEAADPVTFLDSGDAPAVISHGLADCAVPWQQSEYLYDALVANGVRASLTLIEGTLHEVAASCPEDSVVDDFMDEILR